MTRVAITINGRMIERTVEPRTQLVEFLREHVGVTGTHIGCEHGICGACTVELNGEIARSCITLAAACDGGEVRTIEDFDDDPLMVSLRTAFTEEHALQCGYCTPGMLITARDVVRRGTARDADDIRVEMSGNLCRCTGYRGIIRAVAHVLEKRPDLELPPDRFTRLGPAPGYQAVVTEQPVETAHLGRVQATRAGAIVVADHGSARNVQGGELAARSPITVEVSDIVQSDGMNALTQRFVLTHPMERVWALMRNMEHVAAAMPGVSLDGPVNDGRVRGHIAVALGPISARFAGEAEVEISEEQRTVALNGQGLDKKSSSRAHGEIHYHVEAIDAGTTAVNCEIRYALSGPLAQFGRPGIVHDVVARLGTAFAQNVDAKLTGVVPADAQAQKISVFALLWAIIRARIAGLFGN